VVKDRLTRVAVAGLGLALFGALLGGVACSTNAKPGATGSHPDAPAGSGAVDSASGGNSSSTGGTGGGTDIFTTGGMTMDDCNGVSGCGPTMKVPVCGDGVLDPGELCDDGNTVTGDGCISTCQQLEADFVCPTPGSPCVSTVKCGDGKIGGEEKCDDNNTKDNDGCSAKCQVEAGWACPVVGDPCAAAKCGDGIIAGTEQCDDGNATPTSGDGCSATCQSELGWACDMPGKACRKAVCGDGKAEGGEPCDDGNKIVGDGCNPFCEVEPSCPKTGGVCSSRCGDGLKLGAEECDDGNTKPGDGCSADCKVEPGFTCDTVTAALPATLPVPVTFRDVNCLPTGTNKRNRDFQAHLNSRTYGLVGPTLGADGKPVYTGVCELPAACTTTDGPDPVSETREACPASVVTPAPGCNGGWFQTHGKALFDTWYNDTPGTNISLVSRFNMVATGGGAYHYPAVEASLFPLDGQGWVLSGAESADNGHNYGFTSEVRYWFQFAGGETLTFSGDDDVWVFVNGQLAIDLGGVHQRLESTLYLDAATGNGLCTEDVARTVPCATPTRALGLKVGSIYEIALFHAERHLTDSNFDLTLSGFAHGKSQCKSVCGDGVVTADEVCDDGKDNGKGYGFCTAKCTRGSYCGDGKVDAPNEACDDSVNLSQYGGCAPGCVLGPTCGDGVVQAKFEQCDDGSNAGGYGKCAAGCVLGPHCGDGVLQKDQGEECDDGNNKTGDDCSPDCKIVVH
jgi:fibro-slime domain-containing protein